MNGRTVGIMTTAFLLMISVAACQTAPEVTTPEVTTGEGVAFYRKTFSIEEATNAADIAFVGRPTGDVREVEVKTRDPNDPAEPGEGRSYGTVREFEVSRYLKGDGPDSLEVLQYYHTKERYVDGELRRTRFRSDYDSPETGERYLMFLKTDWELPEGTEPRLPDVAYAFKQPSRFRLEDGQAIPDSPWHGAGSEFQPEPEEAVLSKVQASASSDR